MLFFPKNKRTFMVIISVLFVVALFAATASANSPEEIGTKQALYFQNMDTGAVDAWVMDGFNVDETVAIGQAPGANWWIAAVGDINGNGSSDLVWQNRWGRLAAWIMEGFEVADQLPFGDEFVNANFALVDLHDMDGDGNPDAIFQNLLWGNRNVWFMDGLERLGGRRFAVANANWVIAGVEDMGNDGHINVILEHAVRGDRHYWTLDDDLVPAPDESGKFYERDPQWKISAVHDMDGDGKPDIVVQHADGRCELWVMGGERGMRIQDSAHLGDRDADWVVVGAGSLPAYQLSLEATPEDYGMVHGEGFYFDGQIVEVRAEANDGYVFVQWEDSEGEELSAEATFMFTMPANEETITAVFGIGRPEYDKTGLESDRDQAMFALMERFGVAGISAAAVRDGEMTWSGSYGWHDIEAETTLQSDSAIRIASIAKSFTALAVMQLVEEGLIDLDEDINTYLRDNVEELTETIRNPNHPDDPITVKQLLNHTSSIRNGSYVAFNTGAHEAENGVPTLDEYFSPDGEYYADTNWAAFAPGEEFEYSNMAFVVLGAIIESVSGQRFDHYVNEHILEPLEMDDSSFNLNDLDADQVAPMYRRQSDVPHFTKLLLADMLPGPAAYEGYVLGTHGGMFGPQGSLLSTAEDLTKFMIFMINGDEAILGDDQLAEMHEVSVETDKGGAATFWGIYTKKGLGIHITDEFVDGLTMYGHPGGAYGIITDLYYTRDLDENYGVVFLINGCNEDIFGDRSAYYLIEEELADLIIGFADESADVVYQNGVVFAADDDDTIAEALAVKEGKILAVGSDEEVAEHIGIRTEVVDLDGKMILPGFMDSHMHPPGNVLREMYSIALSWRDDIDTILDKVAAFIDENPGLDAYFGGGWSIGVFEGEESTRGPRKERLDAISTEVPIILRSYDGHSTWVNSKALEVAGITDETPNPEGGIIERDPETGEAWGTLKGMAAARLLPSQQFSEAQILEGFVAFQEFMHSLGITGFYTPYPSVGTGPDYLSYKVLQQLEDDGELNLWVRGSAHLDIASDEAIEDQIAYLQEMRDYYADGELFQVTNGKIFMDGTVEAATAKLLEPYGEAAGEGDDWYGIWYWEDMEVLRETIIALNSDGLQVHIHSIGDHATREALNAFEGALAEVPGDHRNAITHLQVVHEDDIPRFAELDVIANVQPYWHLKEPGWWEVVDYPFLGERAEYEYPLQSFFASGALVASSSDYSVTDPPNPLWGIEAGVTRNLNNAEFYEVDDIDDIDDPTWLLNADERASLEDMIKSFTANNAYALFLDDVTGTLEVGKYADLVILDQDLFSIDPLDIDGVQVLQTIFRGRVVYEAE